ncbi:MAG: ATP-binding protein [Defluviitaleaceae bacterium]|nr:ATP-binding protein [Defluviitaleaceae bacterium]MCL2273786.1 ATP-binding protein [Defluviitaleaceae bacterium]
MKRLRHYYLLALVFLLILLSGCGSRTEDEYIVTCTYISCFRDISSLTSYEIEAVENLLARRYYFVYGMIHSTEAFKDADGSVQGYAALFAQWLTGLFGVPFVPQIFTWNELLENVENHSIDFTGALAPSENVHFSTEPIARRTVRYFHLIDNPIENNANVLPRYALLAGSSTAEKVLRYRRNPFEPVFITDYYQAHALLHSREIDALLAECAAEARFDMFGDVISSPFIPFIYAPVSLTTANPELAIIIRVVQAALDEIGRCFIEDLYAKGHRVYLRHKLFLMLDENERLFIQNNPRVYFGAAYNNYPASYFNEYEQEWQGIAFDVLHEISDLTGMHFIVANEITTSYTTLIRMLSSGEIPFIAELNRKPQHENYFLWPDIPYLFDPFVLISRTGFNMVSLERVTSMRVGLERGTLHAMYFFSLFPNHSDVYLFDTEGEAFNALSLGHVDLVMSSYSTLLYLINYLEQTDFMINIIFDSYARSGFGFYMGATELLSIFNDALSLVDTRIISEQIMHRTHDYLASRTRDYMRRLTQAQMPWIISAATLFAVLVLLFTYTLIHSRSERQRMETMVDERTQELSMKTATLTTLVDSIPMFVFMKDANFRYTDVNRNMLNYFNMEKTEVVGKTDEESFNIPHYVAERFRKFDRQSFNENTIVTHEECVPGLRGGNPIFEITKAPLAVEGKKIGIIGIARDISVRKSLEAQLSANYENANKLSNALARITQSPTLSSGDLNDAADYLAKEGCAAFDVDEINIWRVSDDDTQLYYISRHIAVDYDQRIVPVIDLTRHKIYTELLEYERVIVMNTRADCEVIYSPASEVYDTAMCAAMEAPIRIDGKTVGVVCIEQNICEKFPKRRDWTLEEQNFAASLADLMALAISAHQRHNAQQEAEAANRTKSVFLANMSHEIRTPMNAVMGFTELLLQREALPQDIGSSLKKIHTSCDMLLGIINDILDFSKIEAGKMEIANAEYNTASLISDTVQLNIMRINEKPITFEMQIDENLPAKLFGDSLRVKQILNNLLSNAFKYTESGTVRLTINAQPNPKESFVTLEISIQDTGVGMTEEQVEALFHEYTRFTNENEGTIEGTGLGMAITQRLLNFMHGEISVKSEKGKGSVFTIRLPQEVGSKETLGREVATNLQQFRTHSLKNTKQKQLKREPMPYGKVLVVDDVATNLYVATGLLNLYKLQVEAASSGQEAINKIKDGNVYDIIFMDHMMPEMDGIEATRHIHALGYNQPIVALTANAVAGQDDIFLQSGFTDFISKPINVRRLDAALMKYIYHKKVVNKKDNGIDFMQGLARFNGDEELYMEILRAYADDVSEILKRIENISPETLGDYASAVRTIKNLSMDICAEHVGYIAAELENAVRENNFSKITEKNPPFITAVKKLIDELDSLQNLLPGGMA